MNRRSLLKVVGLAAIVDVEQVAADRASGGAGDASALGDGNAIAEDDAVPATTPAGFVARLPALDGLDGGLLAAYARGPALAEHPDAAILGRAEAVGSVVAPDAVVRVGYGGMTRSRIVEHLQREGYREAEPVADRDTFVRRGRGRYRVVVPGDDATAIGRGPAYGPIAPTMERILTRSDGLCTDDLGTTVDLLGGGIATAVEVTGATRVDHPRAEGIVEDAEGSRPVVTGERIRAEEDGASFRRVAVYPSREASLAAREVDWGPWPVYGPVERTDVERQGRAVVRDARASDAAALLAAEE